MTRKPQVTIYTDGACKPNPGPGAWAAVLRFGTREQVLTGSEKRTTNNRMELQAAINALRALDGDHRVDLHTDSTYLQRGISEWLTRWRESGWRRSNGDPVLNADLWRELHELTLKHEVHWHWVRGHSADALNRQADRLAYEALPQVRLADSSSGRSNRDRG